METETWNLGTAIWVAFGVLLFWGLAAAVWDWLLDLPYLLGELRRRRPGRRAAAPATDPSPEPGSEPFGGVNPWAETEFSPMGDAKRWCGTRAAAAATGESAPQ